MSTTNTPDFIVYGVTSRDKGKKDILTLANRMTGGPPFSTGERFNLKEDHSMTITYRIQNSSDFLRIESCGQTYTEDSLHEAIWLCNMELRAGLPRRERTCARREIAHFQELLAALRSAGA